MKELVNVSVATWKMPKTMTKCLNQNCITFKICSRELTGDDFMQLRFKTQFHIQGKLC